MLQHFAALSQGLRRYWSLSLLWLALSLTANSLGPLILPEKVAQFVPAEVKNTYLGDLAALGLVVAALWQPFVGRLSDRTRSHWGRRKPYLLVGTLGVVGFLALLGAAPSYGALLLSVLLLQAASNTVHGPFQALLPDLVPDRDKGTAAGVKGLLELLGLVLGALVAGKLVFGQNYWPALGALGAVWLLALAWTLWRVREPASAIRAAPAAPIAAVVSTQTRRNFLWWLVNRFLFFVGLIGVNQFARNFVEDVVGLPDPRGATSALLITLGLLMLLVVYPAGYLSDRLGRQRLLAIAGLLAAVAVLFLTQARSYAALLGWGALLGLGVGIFISVNWALAAEIAPVAQAGLYLGVTNWATTGGGIIARAGGGRLIDGLNAQQSGAGYTVFFSLCALAFLLSIWPLFRIRQVEVETAPAAA